MKNAKYDHEYQRIRKNMNNNIRERNTLEKVEYIISIESCSIVTSKSSETLFKISKN